jgi:hypothetical protein
MGNSGMLVILPVPARGTNIEFIFDLAKVLI